MTAAEQIAAIAFVNGYEAAIERIKTIVRDVTHARVVERPGLDASRIAEVAFTRDRILFAIDEIAEKAAVKRVALQRASEETEG